MSMRLDADSNTLNVNNNLVDTYKKRLEYASSRSEYEAVEVINFMEFVTNYTHTLAKIKSNGTTIEQLKRRKNHDHIAIRVYQQFSSNQENEQYGKYCKYQLLNYKPWAEYFEKCLSSLEVEELEMLIVSWKEFLKK